MSEQRAVVEDGRVSIEVDYPDGTELTVNVEPLNDPFAHLTPEEDQALRASIERGREQARQGLGRPLDEFLNEL
ncbi:MAG: hypothetical protein AAFP04_10520 [Myxococcota bacterium]